jgi:FkbM family methyltransferase
MSSPATSKTVQGDQAFQHYSMQHRAVAWISQTLFDNFSYRVRHGLIQGLKRKGGLGWLPQFLTAHTETREHTFWKSLDLHGQVVYDVGAFQGLLTLFFACQCSQVISYEPNTKNHARLLENLRINNLRNVTVRKLGLGSRPQEANLVFTALMSGGSSLEANIVDQMKNSNVATVSEPIQITTLDRDIVDAELPPPDFIKIDVEGWELEALKGARNTLASYRPALFLEMHGATMNEKLRKVTELVAWLEDAGYRRITHVESGTAITSSNASVAAEGHLYCRPGAADVI